MSDSRCIGDLIVLDLPLHDPLTGNVSDADALPTAEVFEDDDDTAMYVPAVAKRTGKTGDYRVSTDSSPANGFEVGRSYNVIALAVVNGITRKIRVGSFTLDSPRGTGVSLLDAEIVKLMKELDVTNTRRSLILATTVNATRKVAVGVLDYIVYDVKRDADPDWSSPINTRTVYCWYANLGDIHPIKHGESG